MAVPDTFLAKTIDFNGTQYERLEPITDFRRDPCEARILYTCRMISPQNAEELILKVKVHIMTKMPGQDLMALKFWSLEDEEREERRRAFLQVLKKVWAQGMRPYDCALRNILWDPPTKRCAIVDFEHYDAAPDPINMNETQELQRWGLVHRPPPSHWAVEWGLTRDYNSRQW
ncbi:hypothetical protein NU219Hw_g2032t1 [Hortaea werneckii]